MTSFDHYVSYVYTNWFLGFADLEEKFQEVFERFETLEKDELSCPVTSETSIEEEEPVRCDAEREHNLDFLVI